MKKFNGGHQFGPVRLRRDAEVVQLRLVHALERLEILVPVQYKDGNVILKYQVSVSKFNSCHNISFYQ